MSASVNALQLIIRGLVVEADAVEQFDRHLQKINQMHEVSKIAGGKEEGGFLLAVAYFAQGFDE